MNNTVYMSDLHFEHKTWKNQLVFQKEEIGFFKARLEEIVARWTDKEVLRKVEHFQNTFRVQSNQIDELLHNINVHEDDLVDRVKENPVAVDHVHFDDHGKQRDKIETQGKIYLELKSEFLNFLRNVM